jgi:integrase
MKTKTPTNIKELLNIGGRKLWRGMAYELTAFRNVEHFIELVGNLPLSEVTTTTIDDFVDELRDTVSNATVNRKLANVRTLLEFGADRGWLVMPSFKKKRLTESQGRIRWITDAEETKMLEFLNCEPEVKRFVTVLIDTGLRRGELLQLQAKDVDGLWIRLWTTKSKVARSVPLTERLRLSLQKAYPSHSMCSSSGRSGMLSEPTWACRMIPTSSCTH